jgi:transposase
MFQVEIYGRVRRAVRVEGRSHRAVAKEFGVSRETVRKMLQYAVPPGYQRQQPIKRPKLGPWLGVIDAILDDDKQRPVKQRHTAKRIFERLKEGRGFTPTVPCQERKCMQFPPELRNRFFVLKRKGASASHCPLSDEMRKSAHIKK